MYESRGLNAEQGEFPQPCSTPVKLEASSALLGTLISSKTRNRSSSFFTFILKFLPLFSFEKLLMRGSNPNQHLTISNNKMIDHFNAFSSEEGADRREGVTLLFCKEADKEVEYRQWWEVKTSRAAFIL